ncbi:hypothetical protein FHE72_03830 [Rossellomorea vietnamensis]|uniref:Uncharacterized protein n=1 Tax=Rossellomorea vietnamensis TaxID=218284 RepID=A0A6I6UNM1_9BACI|nr:hypothetical protein [Rossellomorea vietnamensis]QHE60263.1 hypothetical protein FHE72_03830 [Rossellomorea vietnamensis]
MKKKTGYGAMGMGLLILILLSVNFSLFGGNQGSFIQSKLGLAEPIGTVAGLCMVVLLVGTAFRLIWKVSLKRIMIIGLLSMIGVFLLPLILLLFHAGEL